MRTVLLSSLLLAALQLGGCRREPSFDERFGKAESAIREKAAELDSDLAERERQASEAAAVPTSAAGKGSAR